MDPEHNTEHTTNGDHKPLHETKPEQPVDKAKETEQPKEAVKKKEVDTKKTETTQSVDPSTQSIMNTQGAIAPAAFGIVLAAVLLSIFLVRTSRLRLMQRLTRWFPLAHVTIWSACCLAVGVLVLPTLPTQWLFVVLLGLAALVLLNLEWLRSVLSGIAIFFERSLDTGDRIRIEELEGEVMAFRLRSISMRSDDGTIHNIPNERFITESLANLSSNGGDSVCDLVVMIPEEIPADRAIELATNAAMLSPLASPRHRPQVFLLSRQKDGDPLRLNIHGYAFDTEYQEHFKSDVSARLLADFEKELGVG